MPMHRYYLNLIFDMYLHFPLWSGPPSLPSSSLDVRYYSISYKIKVSLNEVAVPRTVYCGQYPHPINAMLSKGTQPYHCIFYRL